MNYRIAGLLITTDDPIIDKAFETMPEFNLFMSAPSAGERPLLKLGYSSSDKSFDGDFTAPFYHINTVDTDIRMSESGGTYILQTICDADRMLMRCRLDEAEVTFSGPLTCRQFKYALWMAYAIRALEFGRIPVHASAVVSGNTTFLFLGESGTGKSTHSRLWCRNIADTTLLNDDSPILAFRNEMVEAYGSPWSGKTPCYRTDSFPLTAMVRLRQAPENRISRLGIAESFAAIHPSMPPAFGYDDVLSGRLAHFESKLISGIPVYGLECLPDREAAILCHDNISEHIS